LSQASKTSRAGFAPLVLGADHLASILDDNQLVTVGHLADGIYVGWLHEDVHRQNCLQAGDSGLRIANCGGKPASGGVATMGQVIGCCGDQHGVNSECLRIYVHENGDGSLVEDAVDRGDEREGSGDDQVSLARAGGDDGQMQTRGAAGDANGMADADVVSKVLLKLSDVRPEAEVASLQYLVDSRYLGIGQVGR
jgi:hypothetical protein